MKNLLMLAVFLTLAGSAMAFDLGAERPDKPVVSYPVNVPGERQGGDTILDAVALAVPGTASGSTAGYTDDYDEVCPYSQSTSPDVVYTMTPDGDVSVNIDLLGSTYDTKVYVYDADLALVACNDDFYADYVSKIEQLALTGGTQYYVIIDGYGGAFGDYLLNIAAFEPCVLEWGWWMQIEEEPPLVDGYLDAHNGGCNSPEFDHPFGQIWFPSFCGVSGWYLSSDGFQYRDTDWFEIVVPDHGLLEVVGDAECATYMFELGPQDCGEVGVIQSVTIGPCNEGSMTITGAGGSTIWFWIGPTVYDGVGEYTYVLETNLPLEVAVERHSWSGVKALFD